MSKVYSIVRELVILGLGEIPKVGLLLEGLADVLWPDGTTDVWDQIKSDVEQLVDKELSDQKYSEILEKLAGIQGLLDEYNGAVKTGVQTNIRDYLVDLILQCVEDLPSFKDDTYGVLLLPLTAQLANIHLGAIRDYYKFAIQWGEPSVADEQMDDFNSYIANYNSWVTGQYEAGRAAVTQTKDDPHRTINWNAYNKYDRSMQLSVLDYQALWPAFKPDGSVPVPLLTREIYSDALGTSDEDPIQTSTNAQLAGSDSPLTNLQVWATPQFSISTHRGCTVEGAQPYYGESAGQLMGRNQDASSTLWFDLGNSYPAVGVYVQSGDLFNAFQVLYQDGSRSVWFPSNAIPAATSYWGFTGHLLSSITIMGISGFYSGVNATNCVVFGFRLLNSYTSPPQKPLPLPAFTQVSDGQKAVPLYVMHKSKTEGDYYDYLTDMVECGSRLLDGFDFVSQSPTSYLLPDNSLYPNAVPVYRMVAHDDSDRIMLAFSDSFYNDQAASGWDKQGLLGYILQDTSEAPSIAPPETVTTQPVYVLHAQASNEDRTMIALSESDYEAQLTVGWGDAGWPKPVGFLFNAS